jgi:hypothetical protein
MNNKIHYISFCSEGELHDKGLNLSNSKQQLTEILNKTDIPYFFYSPRFLKENGYGEYVKEHEKSGLVSMNPSMNLVGFCAWKPLIMMLELEKMNDGDILVYRDCNCEKYGQLKDFSNFHETIESIMNIVNFDFFIPVEDNRLTLGQHVKTNVIKDLAVDVEFTRKFPLLIANTLICRKSAVSMQILEEWKTNCLKDEYINGEQYGELFPEFRWYTPEQGILGVLISNYVLEGRFNIPKNYPNLMFGNRDIHNQIIINKVESFVTMVTEKHIDIGILVGFTFFAFFILQYKSIYKRIKKMLN